MPTGCCLTAPLQDVERYEMQMDKLSRQILLDLAKVIVKFFRKPLHGYGTGIGCMDGNVQGALRKWTKRNRGVKWVDLITQPGINKVLAENTNTPIIENISDLLRLSIFKHRSRTVVIAAHHSCLGNPVDKETQLLDLEKAEKRIRGMIDSFPLYEIGINFKDITIDCLWINEQWMPENVSLETVALKISA